MIRRDAFFAAIRPTFGGALNSGQVAGLTALLTEWERRALTDLRWLAYMMATAKWETAQTMQPIAEIGHGKGRKYGVPGKHGGQVAYGRGYVQLTWDANYEKADAELKLNGALLKNYDLALRPDIAAQILFEGMASGWFTGKKLTDYFAGSKVDWVNARRIINGVDKAQTIAGYGKAFYAALQSASLGSSISDAAPQPLPPDVPPIVLPPPAPGNSAKNAGIGAAVVIGGGFFITQWHHLVSWFQTLFGG